MKKFFKEGNCPHCGAPVFCLGILDRNDVFPNAQNTIILYNGDTPPEIRYSCNCKERGYLNPPSIDHPFRPEP